MPSPVRAADRYDVEPPVHQWIALQAYRKLSADRGADDPLLVEVGNYLPTSEGDAHYSGTFVYSANWEADDDAPYDSATALIEGTCEEDKPDPRCFKHFWNPDGAYDDGIAVFPSGLQMGQDRFRNAVASYRAGDKTQAWYWLGRCIHLLCDLSVPAHAQLDDHTSLEGGDSYENYVSDSEHYRNIRAEDALEVPVRVYPRWTPSDFNTELTSIFYSLADYADQFDSDDVNGSSTAFGHGKYNLNGSIPTDVLADVYQPNLMSRAITSTARLIEFFWREVGTDPSQPHPADMNGDWTLTNTEYDNYANAWKNGQAWPAGPNPIPMNYLTRAGYLAAQGPEYRQTTGISLPGAWEPVARRGRTRR